MKADKKKLKELERESDIATLGLFSAEVQLREAEIALENAREQRRAAYENFRNRKNSFLTTKCADVKLEEFVKQGMSIQLKEPTK